jgi:hypothetical protein
MCVVRLRIAIILAVFCAILESIRHECPGRCGNSSNGKVCASPTGKGHIRMKQILVLFLAATGLLALIPTESKAGIGIYVEPGYYENGYYPGYPSYYRRYYYEPNYYGDYYRWHQWHRWHRHHHHDDDDD